MKNTKRRDHASRIKAPKFRNEAQEATWWASQQAQIADEFQRAAREGRLGRGSVARKGATPTTTIRLDQDDLSRARLQAERKGLRYQTYLKMLLREALLAEEQKMVSRR
jgi:predicted DNA binding CopG/RHH family protein